MCESTKIGEEIKKWGLKDNRVNWSGIRFISSIFQGTVQEMTIINAARFAIGECYAGNSESVSRSRLKN